MSILNPSTWFRKKEPTHPTVKLMYGARTKGAADDKCIDNPRFATYENCKMPIPNVGDTIVLELDPMHLVSSWLIVRWVHYEFDSNLISIGASWDVK